MLRRLMLTTDTVGGVWRYSLELVQGLAAMDVAVTLVTLGPAPSAAQRAEMAAIRGARLICSDLPLDWLAESPAQLEHAARSLARMAARARVDSVHLHTPALVGDARWPTHVVAVAHSCVGTWWRAVHGGALPADLAWRADAVARGIERADAVIAPSRSFAAALRAQYGCARTIQMVYNARGAVYPQRERAPQAFIAGRLWDPGKNVAAVDAAAARLERPVFAAGALVGPHGEATELRHVHWLGQLDEAAMAGQYASAAVFVSPALYEPFGLAVLEAAHAGCALVLSDIPTFRELWDCAAVFVDPHDATRIAELLGCLLRAPARCARLGDLARQRAASLTIEGMTAATWRIHAALGVVPDEQVAA